MKYRLRSTAVIFPQLVLAVLRTVHGDAQPTTKPQKLTNIDYLGRGYDAAIGNPLMIKGVVDPGFQQRVIALDYDGEQTTADGRWLLPNSVEMLQTVNCNYDSEGTTIKTEKQYRDLLSVDASVKGSVFFVSFSASAEYRKLREGVDQHQRVYVSKEARCNVYTADIKSMSTIRPSEEFARTVRDLPTDDYGPYLWLISRYGTHFIGQMVVGAKTAVRSEFEQSTWKRLEEQGFKFGLAADASYKMFALKVGVHTENEKKLAEEFVSSRSTYTEVSIGSLPPPDVNVTWQQWASTSDHTPYPIQYNVRPLTEILSHLQFPGVKPEELAKKRQMLDETVDAYSRCAPNCRIPRKGLAPVVMDRVEELFSGKTVVSCKRSGFQLLSCGLAPKNTTLTADGYAVPLNATSCECSNSPNGWCVLWCTNAVEGLQVIKEDVRRDPQKKTSNITCPAGSKVVSCHTKPSSRVYSRDSYPTDDGNGCLCDSDVTTTCVAVCASNVGSNYVIEDPATGTGKVFSSCSQPTPTSYLLGCGSRYKVGGATYSGYRVFNETHCRCYADGANVTCSAICGQFGANDDSWVRWAPVCCAAASAGKGGWPFFVAAVITILSVVKA